ncbi:hypothetical protein [uncultured Flavobacterium sp.]|uniref:hypothetical protein n=1 Tax=uncultured Flavobacterium sp. TaxID=165435 RepID=UPI0025F44DEF|nr:hypothetical protein [uncultured Flavobacterium sp.]
MKKLLLLTAFFITTLLAAQVPQGISYQAIALNTSGGPVVSSPVGIRLTILENSATGTAIYTESHIKTTNAQGLFNLTIGQGNPTLGTFSTINWGTNQKFLKVEIDVAGGSNFIVVGTTQLLSVPYALTAKKLALQAGEGITLTSPNGTQYQLAVNDNGELSLPSPTGSANTPSLLYLYGSFNNFNPALALLMNLTNQNFVGYKYFTAGTQLKFLSSNTANGAIYGLDAMQNVVLNGSAFTVPANGFYNIKIYVYGPSFYITSINPEIYVRSNNGSDTTVPMTYNVSNNKLTATVTQIVTGDKFSFAYAGNGTSTSFGDNLADGTTDENGILISFPGATSTPRSYRIEMTPEFNGSGSYTVTPL